MEIDTDFSDIRPYRNDELSAILQRVLKGRYLRKIIRELVFPQAKGALVPILERACQIYAWSKLRKFKNIEDFQKKIVIDIGLGYMRKVSISKITWDGVELLSPDVPYIFISTHRDIAVDPAITNYVLDTNGFSTTEIAFGDNLLKNEFISDIIRINKAFIVKRDLPIREAIRESLKLSAYIQDAVGRGQSVWIAQSGGRAKDGIDATNPAVIKMLYYSSKNKKIPFRDFIKKVNIVPLTIAYEYDPCDRLKAWELRRKEIKGSHVKGTHEDMTSLYAGIKGWKGHVHLSFGPVIKNGENEKDVAAQIDSHIYSHYTIFSTNYIAYDAVNRTEKYAGKYTAEEKKQFLERFRYMNEEVRNIALRIYSNPLVMKESHTRKS